MNRGINTYEVRSALFSALDNEALGGAEGNYHKQGSIFVKAESKAHALETLKSFGYPTSTMNCRIGRGNSVNALMDADVITTDALTMVSLDDRIIGKIRFNEEGERIVATVGYLKPQRTESVYGYVFEAL